MLLGAELRFHGSDNDYLLFGLTEDFLYRHRKIMEMDPASFHELAQKEGILFVQAHPFRNGLKIVDPKHLDGIETYNAIHATIRAMRLPRPGRKSLVCWKPPARIFTSGKISPAAASFFHSQSTQGGSLFRLCGGRIA